MESTMGFITIKPPGRISCIFPSPLTQIEVNCPDFVVKINPVREKTVVFCGSRECSFHLKKCTPMKLTTKTPEDRPGPKRRCHLPTINFQGLYSFQGGQFVSVLKYRYNSLTITLRGHVVFFMVQLVAIRHDSPWHFRRTNHRDLWDLCLAVLEHMACQRWVPDEVSGVDGIWDSGWAGDDPPGEW